MIAKKDLLDDNKDESIAHFSSSKLANPITINFKRRVVKMHYIFDYELENLSTANNESSVNLALFCAVFGSAILLWATILSGTDLSRRINRPFCRRPSPLKLSFDLF